MQPRLVWYLALKDLRLFLRDRTALFFFVAFPFIFIIIFNNILSGVGGEDSRLTFHLATREAEGLSHQLIAALETADEAELGPGEPVFIWEKDADEARRKVEAGQIAGFLEFPADFTEGLMMGYGTELRVVADPEAFNTRAALNGLARSLAARLGAQQVVTSSAVGLLVEQGITTGRMPNIATVIARPLSGPPTSLDRSLISYVVDKVGEVEAEQPSNFVIPGYLVMFVFFAAALSAEAIVRERRNHTLERLLASSVKRPTIIAGIYLGTATKGLVQIAIFWAVGILAFRIDLGIAPAAVIILSLLMVLMSAAYGVMLATLAKTERSAGSIGVLSALIMAPLGGCWWPLFITPRWMQSLALVTPHGWATTGFNKLMLFGADFASAVPQMVALAVFAAIFGTVAVLRFRTAAS